MSFVKGIELCNLHYNQDIKQLHCHQNFTHAALHTQFLTLTPTAVNYQSVLHLYSSVI